MKRKLLLGIGIALIFMGIAPLVELRFIRLETTLIKKFLLLILLNLNIMALLVLVYFVGKSIAGLLIERKRKVPGYRFKTKMVLLFVGLIAIPSGILFLTAMGLGSTYIERLFSPQFRKPIENTIEVARTIYETERQSAEYFAEMALRGGIPPPGYRVSRLDALPEDATGALIAAFDGRKASEVISKEGVDVIRAVVPAGTGVVLVETTMPAELTEKLQTIEETYEDYVKLETLAVPLKLNFLLILGFSTMMVIFIALWASLRIAGRITEPIRHLSEATEAVARGDLSVNVSTKAKDEIGLLIGSFNRMVSELKENKESLQSAYIESDKRRLSMEGILENIQSGVISLDGEGRVSTVNSSALRILGLMAEDVIGKDYRAILSGIESGELKKFISSIDLKTLRSAEKEIRATVGTRDVILRVLLTGLRDSSGGYHGLLVVFDDLTNIIKAQRALAWQEVARRVAHEIKNPLTPIKLSTERMLKKWQEGDSEFGPIFERSTNTIIKEVDGLKRLVDEFSKFGKMPEINKRPTALRPVIEDVLSLYKAYNDLDFRLEGRDTTVELDPEQFRRVLINLLDNAVEAMNKQGNVAVRIIPEEGRGRVFIEVADTGPGIPEADKDRLFLPYFSTKKDGTGLGLAIADRIVAEHGGTIRVSDNKPHGSVFVVELPIKEG